MTIQADGNGAPDLRTDTPQATLKNLETDQRRLRQTERILQRLDDKVIKDAILPDIRSANRIVAGRIRKAQRVVLITDAGYPKIDMPERHRQGLLDPDPRPKKYGPARWVWMAAGVLSLALVVTALIFTHSWNLTTLGLTAGGFIAPFLLVLFFMAEPSPEYAERCRQSLIAQGLPGTARFFFKGEISLEAEAARERAAREQTEKGQLFDKIEVVAPWEAFSKETTTGPYTGPYIIVGTITEGHDIFRIEEVAALLSSLSS